MSCPDTAAIMDVISRTPLFLDAAVTEATRVFCITILRPPGLAKRCMDYWIVQLSRYADMEVTAKLSAKCE